MRNALLCAASAAILAACQPAAKVDAPATPAPAAEKFADPDYAALAQQMIAATEIKPGEVVLISTTTAELPIASEVAAAVGAMGGLPIVRATLPEVDKKIALAASLDHLKQSPKGELGLVSLADVQITLFGGNNPDLLADVPADRLAAQRLANSVLQSATAAKKGRFLTLGQGGVGIPTEAYAKSLGVDYAALRGMFWQSVGTPPAEIATAGATVLAKLKPGAEAHLTSPAGTDITFRLLGQPGRMSTGRTVDNAKGAGNASTWLPAGEAYACIDPASASGVIVVPEVWIDGHKAVGLKLQFEKGLAHPVEAKEGFEATQTAFANFTDADKRLSIVDIGLNPKSQMLAGSSFRSWEMTGMVSMVTGDGSWAQCPHRAPSAVSGFLDGATLSVGGTEVVKNGALAQ